MARLAARLAFAAALALAVAVPGGAQRPPGAAAPGGVRGPAGAGAPLPPLRPDPGFAELGARREPLPLPDLIEAALLVSGLDGARIPAYARRIRASLDELASEAGSIREPGARAEAALEFLHRRLFRTYAEEATTVDGILDTGRFNCVSSAVLYLIAARSLGLSVAGVKTKDHAFALVRLPGREVDVETTSPRGFEPGTKKEFTDSFGRVTGFSYVPPGDYARRSAIGEKALLGLVLSNRASLLERRDSFRESLRLGLDLDAMLSDPESRQFLLDRVNNVVAELTRVKDYRAAEEFVGAAVAALGPEPRLLEYARAAAFNRAAGLVEAGRWDEALDLAESLLNPRGDSAVDLGSTKERAGSTRGDSAVDLRSTKERADSPRGDSAVDLRSTKERAGSTRGDSAVDLRSTKERGQSGGNSAVELRRLAEAALGNKVEGLVQRGDFAAAREAAATREALVGPAAAAAIGRRIGDAEIAAAVKRLPFREALAVADRVFSSGSLERARWEEAVKVLFVNEANRLGRGGDWLGAAALADEGARKAPGDGSLGRAAAAYRRNFAVDAHNRFAALYNARDYRAARALVEAALTSLPGDRSLVEDLELAKKALGP